MNQGRVSNNRFLVLYNYALTIVLRRPENGNQFRISDFNSQI